MDLDPAPTSAPAPQTSSIKVRVKAEREFVISINDSSARDLERMVRDEVGREGINAIRIVILKSTSTVKGLKAGTDITPKSQKGELPFKSRL